MKKRALLITLCFLVGAITARASLTASLSVSVQNSARGQGLVFSGTLTNTSATEKLYLNDIVPSLSGASATNLTLKSAIFFSNVPGILLPNESYTESELFRIALSDGAPASDYAGTIIFRGGTDIVANGDLASVPFTVLSPAVSLVSSDSNGSEIGPDAASFTISRSGSATIGLSVVFNISGTAINGIAYNPIASAVDIPAGSSSTIVPIVPIPNNIAEGDRSVILSLGTSSAYNQSASSSATATVHDKPADAWRFAHFGANANDPAAADTADFDGDGIQNLVEFALAGDPKIPDRSVLPSVSITGDYLTISYLPNPGATDVDYVVKSSTNFVNWTDQDVEPVTIGNPNPPRLRTFRYKFPVSQRPRAFLRLELQRLD